MRVLFLVPHPAQAPSSRLRAYQYLPWLKARGIDCEVRPFMSDSLYRIAYEPGRLARKVRLTLAAVIRRLADLRRAAAADVVVMHREAWPFGSAWMERAFIRRARCLVFDFDDAVWLNDSSPANPWMRRLREGNKTAEILRSCSQVIAGNAYLAEYARRFTRKVSVIPTPVDVETYSPGLSSEASRVVIGWVGSATTTKYLEMLQAPLSRVLDRFPQAELWVVGSGPSPLSLPRTRVVPWSLEEEPAVLRSMDIGLMPLPDTPWTQGKCGFKALLYMSAGLPVVASPVGVNSAIVRDGVTGFLAGGTAQWEDALSRLIRDADLRRRMGAAGRRRVESEYSLDKAANLLLAVIENREALPDRSEQTVQKVSTMVNA